MGGKRENREPEPREPGSAGSVRVQRRFGPLNLGRKKKNVSIGIHYYCTRHTYEVGTTQGGPQQHLWRPSLSRLQSLMPPPPPVRVVVAVGVVTAAATRRCRRCGGCGRRRCHQRGRHHSWHGGGGGWRRTQLGAAGLATATIALTESSSSRSRSSRWLLVWLSDVVVAVIVAVVQLRCCGCRRSCRRLCRLGRRRSGLHRQRAPHRCRRCRCRRGLGLGEWAALAAWVPTVAAAAAAIVEVSSIGEHVVWGSHP